MAEILKQLKIKTGVLTRLKKEFQSYEKEVTSWENKINDLPSGSEQNDLKIKKNKQFLYETEAVFSNVKQKLVTAYQDLESFLKQKSSVPEIAQSIQCQNAAAILADVETFLENLN